jgi:hypothetical protein
MSEHVSGQAATETEFHYEPGTDQDLDAGTIWYTLVLGTIITIVVIMLLKALFYKAERDENAAKTYGVKYAQLEDLHNRQKGQLGLSGWRDNQKGLVTIPISTAMAITVNEYAGGRIDPVPAPTATPLAASSADAASGTASAVETTPISATGGTTGGADKDAASVAGANETGHSGEATGKH